MFVSTKNLEGKYFIERYLCFLLLFRNEPKNFLAFWRNFFGRVVQTAFDLSVGSFSEFFLTKKVRSFLSFSHTEQRLYGIQSNIFQQGCQKKLSKFLLPSGHWEKKFRPFDEKNAAGLPKLLSTCVQEQFERNNFFENLEFLLSFSDMSKKILAFCQFSFDWIVKSVFYKPEGTTRPKKFSRKIEKIWVFNFVSDFDQKKKSALRQAFFGRVGETAFYVSINIFWGELFEKKHFSVIFGQRAKFFLRCKTQYSTCLQDHSNQIFLEKMYFFFLFFYWAKIFGILSKDFSEDCQNWILRVHRKPWKKNIFF